VKYLLILSIILLFTVLATADVNFARKYANIIRIAVIDTGVSRELDKYVCHDDSKSFVDNNIYDAMGHGTSISNIIKTQANTENFCLVVVKFYDIRFQMAIDAIDYVSKLQDIDIVNLSYGGDKINELKEQNKEKKAIKKLLNRGIKVVAAAGNQKKDLTGNCNFYPACHDSRIIVVGSSNKHVSNYGTPIHIVVKIDDYATSEATAFITGTLANILAKKHKVPNIDPKRPFKTGEIK
jgi:subtilisin family serine protease